MNEKYLQTQKNRSLPLYKNVTRPAVIRIKLKRKVFFKRV